MIIAVFTVHIPLKEGTTPAQVEQLGDKLRDAVYYTDQIHETKAVVVERLASYTPKPMPQARKVPQ